MSDSSPDLTTRIEPAHARALELIARVATHVGVDWFLVGALARDWLLEVLHAVPTLREAVGDPSTQAQSARQL